MQADVFMRIFEISQRSAGSLLFADPDQLEQNAGTPEAAAWQLLLGSMALRRAGHRSPANEWLNRATRQSIGNDVFRAELLGEAGQGLSESDRLEDAFGILNSALAIWHSATDAALSARSSAEAADAFVEHLVPLLEAGDVDTPVDGDAQSLVSQWLVQRAAAGRAETAAAFIRVLARGGQVEDGRRVCIDEVEWTTRIFVPRYDEPRSDDPLLSGYWGDLGAPQAPRPVRVALYILHLARGEVELAAGEFESSAQYFAEAAAVFERSAADYTDVSRLLRAKFNQANSLLRLERFDEALAIYEMCEYGLNSIGDEAGAQRVAHAKLYARNAAGDGAGTTGDARQLVIDAEKAARESADAARAKAALLPQYGMHLTALCKDDAPLIDRAEDCLRIIAAIRDAETYANLEFAPRGDDSSIEQVVGSPLRVLAGYLARLPDTAVLMIETGAKSLAIFALRGGDAALEARVVLEPADQEFIDAIVALIEQQREDLDRIANRERIDRKLFDPIRLAAEDVWNALPESVRAVIEGASTLLYLPGAFGDLSAFPLELVRSDGGWLGETHSIARLSSLRTLLELLSPNRMPASLDARALIVRAEDSDELMGADEEIMGVTKKLETLGMRVGIDMSPRVGAIRDALDDGLRILHYCGHGLAGSLGESLPLNANERLGPHDFSQLSGWGTPFVYLSTCEVGRARMTTTGSAVGFSTRLIEKGAPGVVGCLESVPDVVAQTMANAFYGAVGELPLGAAMSQARTALDRFPPSCRGAFAYFGDPSFSLTATGADASGVRQQTLRWDSLVGRHVALRSAESRQRVLDALDRQRDANGSRTDAADTAAPGADTLDAVAVWIEASFGAEEPEKQDVRLALCVDVARHDAVAGCQLRMLLAMEVLQGTYFGDRKPDIVMSPEELAVGLFCARAVHDTIAWPAFVAECVVNGGAGYDPAHLHRMVEEAAGMLAGWSREEPAAASMLSVVERFTMDPGQPGQANPIDVS